jgi:hypothetical protein
VRVAAAAGAGFLLCVLWFDLMFDVQRDAGIDSTAAYYRRVTTDARPMNRLIAATMVWTIVALTLELVRGDARLGIAAVSLVFAIAAVGLAALRTVRDAIRLGQQSDPRAAQSRLARSIRRDHTFCFAAIAIVVVLQVFFAAN